MIHAVTVDWWHTIAEPHGADWEDVAKRMRIEGIRGVLRAHGIECTLARLDVAYDLWTDHLARAWRGNVDWSPDVQVLDFLASAGYDGSATPALVLALREPIGAPLVTYPPRIHAGAREALAALRGRGRKIALVSNTGRTWGEVLRGLQDRLGLSALFDHRTFSDEVRIRKPGRAIFTQTLEALGVAPEETVHIGDDVVADVRGAKEAGMQAIWYDTGRWKGVTAEGADAIAHAWRDVPGLVEGW